MPYSKNVGDDVPGENIIHKYGAVDGDEKCYDEVDVERPSYLANRNRFMSAFLVVCCVLIGDMTRGILFPTLWLLVQSVGGSHFYQGCAVSAFSAGRIVSSPVFGYASERIGYKYILALCNMIIAIGCYFYSLSNSITWIVASHLLLASVLAGWFRSLHYIVYQVTLSLTDSINAATTVWA